MLKNKKSWKMRLNILCDKNTTKLAVCEGYTISKTNWGNI